MDALAIEGRPQRLEVRLELLEQQPHLLVVADREQGLHDIVGEGVVEKLAERLGGAHLVRNDGDDLAVAADRKQGGGGEG